MWCCWGNQIEIEEKEEGKEEEESTNQPTKQIIIVCMMGVRVRVQFIVWLSFGCLFNLLSMSVHQLTIQFEM